AVSGRPCKAGESLAGSSTGSLRFRSCARVPRTVGTIESCNLARGTFCSAACGRWMGMNQAMRGASLLFACTALAAALPAAATTLVYCSEGDPEGFNPALVTSGTAFDAGSRQVFDRLVEFDAAGNGVVPGLATSWT